MRPRFSLSYFQVKFEPRAPDLTARFFEFVENQNDRGSERGTVSNLLSEIEKRNYYINEKGALKG